MTGKACKKLDDAPAFAYFSPHSYLIMPDGTLLLIDDEAPLRRAIARMLELEGYTVLQASDARPGLDALQQHAQEVLVILSDVKLPDGYGLDLLPRYKVKAPLAEVILLTAYGTIPDSVRAMREGAFDYLTKGDSDDQLVVIVDRAAEKARLQHRGVGYGYALGQAFGFLQSRRVPNHALEAVLGAHFLL